MGFKARKRTCEVCGGTGEIAGRELAARLKEAGIETKKGHVGLTVKCPECGGVGSLPPSRARRR